MCVSHNACPRADFITSFAYKLPDTDVIFCCGEIIPVGGGTYYIHKATKHDGRKNTSFILKVDKCDFPKGSKFWLFMNLSTSRWHCPFVNCQRHYSDYRSLLIHLKTNNCSFETLAPDVIRPPELLYTPYVITGLIQMSPRPY